MKPRKTPKDFEFFYATTAFYKREYAWLRPSLESRAGGDIATFQEIYDVLI
jgi:hypothetical protein